MSNPQTISEVLDKMRLDYGIKYDKDITTDIIKAEALASIERILKEQVIGEDYKKGDSHFDDPWLNQHRKTAKGTEVTDEFAAFVVNREHSDQRQSLKTVLGE